MKVLFVNDSSSNPNWGDRAAAIALNSMISAVGGHVSYALTESALSASQLGSLSAEDEPITHSQAISALRQVVPPGLVTLARRGRRGRSPIPESWKGFPEVARTVSQTGGPWPALIRAMLDSDVVLIHGDGAMTGNGIIPRTMLLIAYVAKVHHSKPVAIVNHTADFSDPGLLSIAREVYPLLDDVVFREPISVDRCQYICNGRYAADASFLLEPAPRASWTPIAGRPTYFDVWPDAARFDPAAPYVCVGGSSLLPTARCPQTLTQGYRSLIQRIRSEYDGAVVLTVSDLMDQSLFRRLAREMDLPLVGLRTPVQQVVDILGNADAYVGGRWNPGIFALRGGSAIIPFAGKTSKMEALAGMVRLGTDSLPDPRNLEPDVDRIVGHLMGCLERGQALRGELESWAQAEASSCWGNVSRLESL